MVTIVNYRKYAYYTLAGALVLSACQSEQEKQLMGKWRATQLVECAEVKSVDMRNVYLEFNPDGQYTFNSTFNTAEKGQFKLRRDYLFLKRQDIQKNNTKSALRCQCTRLTSFFSCQ